MLNDVVSVTLGDVVDTHKDEGKAKAHEQLENTSVPLLSLGLPRKADRRNSLEIAANAQCARRDRNRTSDSKLSGCAKAKVNQSRCTRDQSKIDGTY